MDKGMEIGLSGLFGGFIGAMFTLALQGNMSWWRASFIGLIFFILIDLAITLTKVLEKKHIL